MVLKTVTPRIPTISFWFPPTGQSQWSSLVLVAPRRTSAGEPSPAHHPRHDLPQGPPHRHPQSSHLRHPQAAAVIGPFPPPRAVQRSIGSTQRTPVGFQWRAARSSTCFLAHPVGRSRAPLVSDFHCLFVFFYIFRRESDCFRAAVPGSPVSLFVIQPFSTHTHTHSGRSMKLQHIFERLTSQAGVRNKSVRYLSWHCFCLCSKPVTELKTRVAIANRNCYTSLFKTSVAETLRTP